MATPLFRAIIDGWLKEVASNVDENQFDDPNYYAFDPRVLLSSSRPETFGIGTGHQILKDALSACELAQHEVIIVTCFWAKSDSRDDVVALLRTLSDRAVRSGNGKIQVRICFSSYSVWQKLTQTGRIRGATYAPSTARFSSWARLGLPSPKEIPGLNLVVKSVFVRPFSVMHPKFIIIDRQRAFLPSCNVSWEGWFEGCIELTGPAVGKLFEFWDEFWSRGGASLDGFHPPAQSELSSLIDEAAGSKVRVSTQPILQIDVSKTAQRKIPTILLPSPHHRRIDACPGVNLLLLSQRPPPPTPLNVFLTKAFRAAQKSIYIQTPNLTCRAVKALVVEALSRGVNVRIVTSKRLMLLEQIVTARTVTEVEIHGLQRTYASMMKNYERKVMNDPEVHCQTPGELSIGYYHPKDSAELQGDNEEPVKSHLKLTIVDEEVVVLGSGNMDHASWYTSQELGIALFSTEIAELIRQGVEQCLEGRVSNIPM
ncbi:hypothetical protein BP5796_07868 [Coleophoma crateriformis]|uniref:PLD phosphodiesterase domain-containing protein n=1 Tax=Coleophoma crateriformis TaxID=565419 RepID=A0A3D8RD83_9HELO|nr:hypothetical protein BP5796_07868 [Coleophoma crateriformis]